MEYKKAHVKSQSQSNNNIGEGEMDSNQENISMLFGQKYQRREVVSSHILKESQKKEASSKGVSLSKDFNSPQNQNRIPSLQEDEVFSKEKRRLAKNALRSMIDGGAQNEVDRVFVDLLSPFADSLKIESEIEIEKTPISNVPRGQKFGSTNIIGNRISYL